MSFVEKKQSKIPPNLLLIAMYIMMLYAPGPSLFFFSSFFLKADLSSSFSWHFAIYLFSVRTRRVEIATLFFWCFVSMFFFWKLAAVSLLSVVWCLRSQQQPREVMFHICSENKQKHCTRMSSQDLSLHRPTKSHSTSVRTLFIKLNVLHSESGAMDTYSLLKSPREAHKGALTVNHVVFFFLQ